MNYYKILNVYTNATDKEIKKAYRLLAKKYHPDMYQGDKNVAEDRMQEINEAYDTLSDVERRKDYDKSIGLNKEPQVEKTTYDFSSRKTTSSYNNVRNYNVRYKPNNANTYYDSYGYAETNYSPYTGDRYTRNKYSERIKLDRKDVAIKITVLLVFALIILIGLINMIIDSFSEISNAKTEMFNDKGISQNESKNVNYNSKAVEKDLTENDKYEEWVNELKNIEVDEEMIKQKLNDLVKALEEYNNSKSSN